VNFIQVPPQPAVEEQWKLTCARLNEWLQDEVFSIKWWIMLALFLITAFVWWKTVNKSRLAEMMLFTLVIMIFIIALDELGEELSLWYYTIDLVFLFPPITAIDITSMPLIYMLLYQRFTSWKSFLIATTVMATVFCFVFEPIFVWGGVYKMLIWKSYYGFPIYILIAVMSKFTVNRITAAS
jgi:hypothetical protein